MSRHSHAADDDFKVGTRQQTAWGTHMATAFFFGEAGAGLFLYAFRSARQRGTLLHVGE